MPSPTPATLAPPSPPDVTATVSNQADDTRVHGFPTRSLPVESAEPAPPPQIGDRVSEYVLEAKLGEGVSSHVYRARDAERSCSVALKIMNWENAVDKPAAMKQLRTEAAALSRVKHPNIVRFLDFGFDRRWPYLVVEFIEGQSLGEMLRDGGSLPPAWALHVLSQMVDALGAVWKAGYVHRDIKPDNILIGSSGTAKLIDFGLAKSEVVRASRGEVGPELAGTAAYIAPEQAKNASVVDHRADIYSLGVTFYEALTGQLPFQGRTRMQMIYQHLNAKPVPPMKRSAGVPPLASELCLWMLAKDPADRPRNHAELRHAFDSATNG